MRRVWLGVVAFALAGAAACQPTTPSTSSSAQSSSAITTPSTTVSSLPRARAFSTASITLTPIQALPNAITMATRKNDPMLYVGTQNGKIYAIDPASPNLTNLVLDIGSSGDNLIQCCGEQGLLGMTFSADGATLYVHYTAPGGDASGTTTVAEYDATPAAPSTVNPLHNPKIVLEHPRAVGTAKNHNGGSLLLGPESTSGNDILYLALGDGGSGNDQGFGHTPGLGNAQDLTTLHGKILRFHPLAGGNHDPLLPGNPFTTPGNPFTTTADVTAGNKPEVWAYGLRNPFRFSFDKTTGDLWIGDVGQGLREEIDFVAANDPKYPRARAANFGWNLLEGFIHGPNAETATRSQTARPVFDIDHNHADCAIIGGYVYRGTGTSLIQGLLGAYVYSDYCNGSIRGLMVQPGGKGVTNRPLGATVSRPSSFGEDQTGLPNRDGDLYVLSLTDGLLKIVQGP